MELTEEEYIIYLLKLRKYEEFELLNKCIMINRSVFFHELGEFDNWLIKQITLSPKRSLRGEKMNLVNALEDTFSVISKDNDFGKSTFGKKSSSNLFINDDLYPKYNNITVEEYINRIKPIITSSKADRIKYKVFSYHVVTILSSGNSFGDLALIDKNGKRQGSIIILEDTHFGFLDKFSFDNCLKNVKENQVKSKLNILTDMNCFCTFSKAVFNKKYLNLFVSMQSNRGMIIMKQGEPADSIVFLKDGEYEIKIRRSLLEINALIKELGGEINTRNENSHMLGIGIII
jgi:hypothetical protein